MTTDTGEPAFPVRLPIVGAIHACDEPVPTEIHAGMTMRDYFAGRAMQAVMGNHKVQEYWGEEYSVEEMMQFTAKRAYEQADAMLKARAT